MEGGREGEREGERGMEGEGGWERGREKAHTHVTYEYPISNMGCCLCQNSLLQEIYLS